MNPIPCTICKEDGHTAAKCPTLVDPLRPGFSGAGGGGGGHSHEEEDKLCVCVRGGVCGIFSTGLCIRTEQCSQRCSHSANARRRIGL